MNLSNFGYDKKCGVEYTCIDSSKESHKAPKNFYIDLRIFPKIFHCELSCMSTHFWFFFTNNYCFCLNNLQDSSQTWKGGHFTKDISRYPKGQGTLFRPQMKFLLYTFKNICIYNVNIFTCPSLHILLYMYFYLYSSFKGHFSYHSGGVHVPWGPKENAEDLNKINNEEKREYRF